MRRRPFLALAGSTLAAGCATLGPGATESSPSPAPVPSDTPSPTPSPPGGPTDEPNRPDQRWSLVELRTRPLTVSLTDTTDRTQDGGELTLEFARTADGDHPATVQGVFRNANPFENTFDLRGLPLFRNVPTAWPGGRPRDDSYTYRDELVLAPTERHDLAETVPELTLSDDGRWRLAREVNGPWLPETHRLGSGEQFRVEYALVGRPDGQGFPRARYHFGGYGHREVVFDVWATDRPGPSGDSRFAGEDAAPLPPAEEMAWSHEAGEDTAVYLEPSVEQAALPAKIDFTLVNHSHQPVAGNPFFWRLWKRVDGRWFHVAPWGWPLPLRKVSPGGRSKSTLAAFPDQPVDCDDARGVGHLGGGRYAYEVGIGRKAVTHAARLDFEAPSVAIEPTGGLDVSQDGGVVRVDWPRRQDDVPRATLTLTRTHGAETRLIPEQVMQSRNVALRNTVPFLESAVEQVRLVTDRNTVSRGVRTSGYEDGAFRFRLSGQAYEAAAQFGTDE